MSDLQKQLEAQLVGLTVETVEVDERYTADGQKNVNLKITFDNGHSMQINLGNDGNDTRPPMRTM